MKSIALGHFLLLFLIFRSYRCYHLSSTFPQQHVFSEWLRGQYHTSLGNSIRKKHTGIKASILDDHVVLIDNK